MSSLVGGFVKDIEQLHSASSNNSTTMSPASHWMNHPTQMLIGWLPANVLLLLGKPLTLIMYLKYTNLFPSLISARNEIGINAIPPSWTGLQKATAEAITAVKSVLSEKAANVLKTHIQKGACFILSNALQLMDVWGWYLTTEKRRKIKGCLAQWQG